MLSKQQKIIDDAIQNCIDTGYAKLDLGNKELGQFNLKLLYKLGMFLSNPSHIDEIILANTHFIDIVRNNLLLAHWSINICCLNIKGLHLDSNRLNSLNEKELEALCGFIRLFKKIEWVSFDENNFSEQQIIYIKKFFKEKGRTIDCTFVNKPTPQRKKTIEQVSFIGHKICMAIQACYDAQHEELNLSGIPVHKLNAEGYVYVQALLSKLKYIPHGICSSSDLLIVKKINLSNTELHYVSDSQNIFRILPYRCQRIDLSHNHFGSNNKQILKLIFRSFRFDKAKEINLSHTRFANLVRKPNKITHLSEAMSKLQPDVLNLEHNQLGRLTDNEAEVFYNFLKGFDTKVKCVKLGGNDFTRKQILEIEACFRKNIHLYFNDTSPSIICSEPNESADYDFFDTRLFRKLDRMSRLFKTDSNQQKKFGQRQVVNDDDTSNESDRPLLHKSTFYYGTF